jgi:predicted nucleotidyltransferase
MSREVLIHTLRRALAAHPGVELAILFGSRARGDAGLASDADLAVLGDGVDLVALAVELERVVSLPVDVTDLRAAPYPLLLAVVRDAIPVFERTRGAHARFVSSSLADLETDLPNLRLMQRGFVERVAARGLLPTSR